MFNLSSANAMNLDRSKIWYLGGELHSSVGGVVDLRTGGRWFDPRLGQYSFRGLMIIIPTGFIPFSPLSVVSTMVMWEPSQWLGNNIVRSKKSRIAWMGALALAI